MNVIYSIAIIIMIDINYISELEGKVYISVQNISPMSLKGVANEVSYIKYLTLLSSSNI